VGAERLVHGVRDPHAVVLDDDARLAAGGGDRDDVRALGLLVDEPVVGAVRVVATSRGGAVPGDPDLLAAAGEGRRGRRRDDVAPPDRDAALRRTAGGGEDRK